jgi:hypothetical protein
MTDDYLYYLFMEIPMSVYLYCFQEKKKKKLGEYILSIEVY